MSWQSRLAEMGSIGRQLVREFWLPFVLGVGWTAYNLVDQAPSEWSGRRVLNVLGPTFFFMSWLVAQWYRVRKQQRVENDLYNIHEGVRAVHEPLLPCSVFLTLRGEETEANVEAAFKDTWGFQNFRSEVVPSLLSMLPPGVSEGRIMLKHLGYLDFSAGKPTKVGVFRFDEPWYNVAELSASHTACVLVPTSPTQHRLIESLSVPTSVILDVFLEGWPRIADAEPSLRLESGMPPFNIERASVVDTTTLVDVWVRLAQRSVTNRPLSWRSLEGAFLRVTLDFVRFGEFGQTAVAPRLHNLYIKFDTAGRMLTFALRELEQQVYRPDPNPTFVKGTKEHQIVFECLVATEMFKTSMRDIH